MKKLIMSTVCAMISMMSFADTNNVAEAVDVYEFKASIKQPILKSGVRTYTTVSLKGDLYLEYESVDEGISAAYAIVQNSKTKVMHRIDFTDGFYHLMGKSTKTTVRSLPTVILSGSDSECYAGTGKGAQEPHEAITFSLLVKEHSSRLRQRQSTVEYVVKVQQLQHTATSCISLLAM